MIFNRRKFFQYFGLSKEAMVEHIQPFILDIWQIHLFWKGNTPFQKHAEFFRDALVLDNAKILQKRLEFLTVFFENLLLSGENVLSSEEIDRNLGLDKNSKVN